MAFYTQLMITNIWYHSYNKQGQNTLDRIVNVCFAIGRGTKENSECNSEQPVNISYYGVTYLTSQWCLRWNFIVDAKTFARSEAMLNKDCLSSVFFKIFFCIGRTFYKSEYLCIFHYCHSQVNQSNHTTSFFSR